MITVNRVYVDAEGYIEDGKGHRFEDQEQIKKLMQDIYPIINPDLFYTIEPIPVEIVDSWGPFHENTFPDKFARIVTEEEKPAPTKHRNPKVFIRDGELYAFVEPIHIYSDHPDSNKSKMFQKVFKAAKDNAFKVKNQEEVRHYLLRVLNWNPHPGEHRFDEGVDNTLEGYQMEVGDFYSCKLCGKAETYNTKCDQGICGLKTVKLAIVSPVVQPAPVVDKPGKTASEILFDHGIDMNWTDSWFYEQAVKAVEQALHQQPTEWIPVSERVPDHEDEVFVLQKGKIKTDHYCLPVEDWPGAWYKTSNVTHWLPMSSLPEPPKP